MTQSILCFFVSYLGKNGLAYSTIKGYLAAVRNLQIGYRWPCPAATPMPKLEQVLRGIKISQARAGRLPRRKLPITPAILRQVKQAWSGINTDFHQTLLWAAATTCFFGFLRCGEITLKPTETFDPASHLSFQDIAADSRSVPSFSSFSKLPKWILSGRESTLFLGPRVASCVLSRPCLTTCI